MRKLNGGKKWVKSGELLDKLRGYFAVARQSVTGGGAGLVGPWRLRFPGFPEAAFSCVFRFSRVLAEAAFDGAEYNGVVPYIPIVLVYILGRCSHRLKISLGLRGWLLESPLE